MPEFLLEIGCEELPAAWLPGLTDQLRQRFAELLSAERLEPREVDAASTPRRLVVKAVVRGRQDDREETVWGPALRIARDAEGRWTGAAQGFARKLGVRPEDLQQGTKPGGGASEPYVFHVKKVAGRPAEDVLAELTPAVLRALSFPKRMNWDAWLDDGKGAFGFGRPIRWLVAVVDGRTIPCRIHAVAGDGRGDVIVEGGDHSYGHRFLPRGAAGAAITVRSYQELRETLKASFVILEPAERETLIRSQLGEHAASADPALIAEWVHLVEYPTVLFGEVPAEFRTLPAEVLRTVLVHHQKYVPITHDGSVARFAALTNTDAAGGGAIVRNMERVVVARLRDAAFFHAEDLKRPLLDRVEDLAGVTFHKGLGTYEQKARRMADLVDRMADMGLLSTEEREAARQAALLAKADLTTLMVREFPELQGTMGAIYLAAQGAPAEVSDAVRWHYHPLSIDEGAPPANALAERGRRVFSTVSLADKLDTLAGYFRLHLAPSGSSDPFGLRRAAQGAVRVLIDFWPPTVTGPGPSLRALAAAALAGYEVTLRSGEAAVQRELEAFLFERLRYVLAAREFPPDEVEAVLGAREPDALDDPHEAWLRLQALHRVRSEACDDFEHLAVAFKRAKNIVAEGAQLHVEADLLREPAERELHAAVGRLAGVDGGYEARLRSLAGLRRPVDRFFDDVLVMAEDPALRANRLGLLGQALSLFYRIADISKLGGAA
jgi:glycyl-tRNA synthetase beta chain